jgi:glyoxylate/hydroxypyruvate reductase A
VRCATQECCDKLIEMHKEQALKGIFIIGAGINDFVNLAKQNPVLKEIPVIRNDNLDIANDMADYALMHCLMQYRDMPYYLNAQQNKNYAPLELHKKSDFPVGIMGGGNLGGTVAKALTQNGFNVQIWKRTAGNVGDIKCLHGQQDLGKFLSSTRILINLLPLTQETTGILNKELLSQLPNKSIVMNLARGQHQKTDDIIKLLNNGKLSHAVLDVTEEEPIPKNNPIWQNPKVTLTQHTAAKTRIDNACETHIQKISELQKGKNMKQISGRVDLEQGY